MSDERLKLLFYQLERVVRRVRLLQRALALLYVTLGAFVGTSIAIGLVQLTNTEYTWLPLGLAIWNRGSLPVVAVTCVAFSRSVAARTTLNCPRPAAKTERS